MYSKTGFIVPDLQSLCYDTRATADMLDYMATLSHDSFIILSLKPTSAPPALFRARFKRSLVTDIRTLSPARLSRLCDTVIHYDFGHITPMPTNLSSPPKPSRVGLFISNGFGLGHVTRMQAMADLIAPHAPCANISLSAGCVNGAHYLASPQYLNLIQNDLARQYVHETVTSFFNRFDPTHIIYDGNVLPDGLLSALARRPDIHLTWLRRAMWPKDIDLSHMASQALCDLVIEPGELAAEMDSGPTWKSRMEVCPPRAFFKTAPIRPKSSLYTCAQSRAALGLSPTGNYTLIMLGATQNQEHLNTLKTVLAAMPAGQTPIIAHWPMAHSQPPKFDGAITLEQMPLQPYYNAFDRIISAAGYNSFHELMATDIPTIFIPQEMPGTDQQLARAQYAQSQGWAAFCRTSELEKLPTLLSALSNQKRPNIPFFTDADALLKALNITPSTGGVVHFSANRTRQKTIYKWLKSAHKRRKTKTATGRFVLAKHEHQLQKLNPATDIVITHTIPPVALRRAGFKYLWLNDASDVALKRQLFVWLKLWHPAHIKSA